MQEINVKEIVEEIKKDVDESGMSVKEQYLLSHYYTRRIAEYKKESELVIFGAGNYGLILYEMLEKEGVSKKLKCFCDNNKSRHDTYYRDLVVISPEEAFQKYPNAMFIVTPKGYENEIIRQLVGMGIEINKISAFILGLTGLEE